MFDNSVRMRNWLSLGWIAAFMAMIMTFYFSYTPLGEAMQNDISQIEQSIAQENWATASGSLADLEERWKKMRLVVNVNNTPEDIGEFERKLEQIKTLTNQKEDDALQYVGELRVLARSIILSI